MNMLDRALLVLTIAGLICLGLALVYCSENANAFRP